MRNRNVKPTPLNHGYWHEAIDRAWIVQDLFDRNVAEHPVIVQTPELNELADKAGRALMDLYQAIGRLYPNFACKEKS